MKHYSALVTIRDVMGVRRGICPLDQFSTTGDPGFNIGHTSDTLEAESPH